MLAYGSVPEKIAALSESLDIFVQCAHVGPALRGTYGKSTEQVAFFMAHDEIGVSVTPIDTLLLTRYHTPEDQQRITRVVRLSHEFELLFYKTVMAVPPSERVIEKRPGHTSSALFISRRCWAYLHQSLHLT